MDPFRDVTQTHPVWPALKGLSTHDAYALRHGHGMIFTACVWSVNFVLNAHGLCKNWRIRHRKWRAYRVGPVTHPVWPKLCNNTEFDKMTERIHSVTWCKRIQCGQRLKGCPHWMRMRHVTEWIRSINLSNSVWLHDLGHTGCVTGPTR